MWAGKSEDTFYCQKLSYFWRLHRDLLLRSVAVARLTRSNKRSFSTSISSPIFTSSFFANCIVGIAITPDMSVLGKTYCSSFVNLFGQICAEISRRSLSIWYVPKMHVLLGGWLLLEKVDSSSMGQSMKFLLELVITSVIVIGESAMGTSLCWVSSSPRKISIGCSWAHWGHKQLTIKRKFTSIELTSSCCYVVTCPV